MYFVHWLPKPKVNTLSKYLHEITYEQSHIKLNIKSTLPEITEMLFRCVWTEYCGQKIIAKLYCNATPCSG